MSLQPLTLKADLDDDGVFEEDWSAYLLGVRDVGLGRRAAVDRFSPRRATFRLDNTDGRFSPRNTSGPYSPNLSKGKRVRLAAQVTIAAVTNLMRMPSAEFVILTYFAALGTGGNARDAAGARFGRWGVKTTESGAATAYGVEQISSSAPATGEHTASVYVKGEGDSAGKDVRLTLRAKGGAGGDETATATLTLTTGWQRITATLNVTAGDHTDMDVELERVASLTAGELFYSDAWMLETGTAASLYCDGTQAACSWSGAAHASTSSRTANPTFNLFTGELRSFKIRRRGMRPIAEFKATGLTESVLRTLMSCGPFGRKPADVILQRVLDIIEGLISERILGLTGEALRDGGFRFGGDAWTALGSATLDTQKDTGGAGDDPVEYTALEDSQVMEIDVSAIGDGADHDITGAVTFGKPYHVSGFMRAGDANADGEDAVLIWRSNIGDIAQQQLTLSQNSWTHFSLSAVLPGGAVSSFIRIVTSTGGWGSGGKILVDGIHVSPIYAGSGTPQTITNSVIGTKWTTELEYLDAFHRSCGATLRELAASVGGWFYENGDGDLVFEDYSQRDPAVVPIPGLRLSDIPEDAMGYDLKEYEEPAASLAGSVKVGSYGDVHPLPAPDGIHAKQPWALEPVPLSLAANERRVFYADYVGEDESAGGLISRRTMAVALPIAGFADDDGVSTPYAINYGRSGEVVVKAGAGGDTIYALVIGARVQNRQTTERAFLVVGSGDPVMELEMPAQGLKTQAMTDLGTWALAKYGPGPALLDVVLEGATAADFLEIFGRGIGLPVWVRHVQGPGALGVDALFYTEGWRLDVDAERMPRLTLALEEGPE